MAAHLIRTRKQDQAMHGLDRPAALDKTRRQKIQQLRVSGTLADRTPVVGRTHQALVEMPLPDAVDHDARGQRMRGTGQPARQLDPSTTVVNLGAVISAQRPWEAFLDRIARIVRVSAYEHFLLDRLL